MFFGFSASFNDMEYRRCRPVIPENINGVFAEVKAAFAVTDIVSARAALHSTVMFICFPLNKLKTTASHILVKPFVTLDYLHVALLFICHGNASTSPIRIRLIMVMVRKFIALSRRVWFYAVSVLPSPAHGPLTMLGGLPNGYTYDHLPPDYTGLVLTC